MAVTKAMMGLKVIVTKIQKILLKDRVHYTGQAELLRSLKCQILGYNFVSLSCKDKKGKPIAVLD